MKKRCRVEFVELTHQPSLAEGAAELSEKESFR